MLWTGFNSTPCHTSPLAAATCLVPRLTRWPVSDGTIQLRLLIRYINRNQPSVWLTRNHLFQMLWFDLLETKDCLFLLLSWGKQMLIGWPLVVGVRILKTNRGSIAEAAVWLWFSIFFHNAMLGHTHWKIRGLLRHILQYTLAATRRFETQLGIEASKWWHYALKHSQHCGSNNGKICLWSKQWLLGMQHAWVKSL